MDDETKKIIVSYAISVLFLTGCGSTITVKKISDDDKGIPYYLPKPYLLITQGFSATEYKEKVTENKNEKSDGSVTTKTVKEQVPVTTQSDQVAYSMKIIYLPDLRAKYGIAFNPGAGKSDSNFALENGWKLTSLTENTDTKVAETITATAALATALTPMLTAIKTADISVTAQELIEFTKVPEKAPEYSICIYEMVLDGNDTIFNLDKPVFKWSSKEKEQNANSGETQQEPNK